MCRFVGTAPGMFGLALSGSGGRIVTLGRILKSLPGSCQLSREFICEYQALVRHVTRLSSGLLGSAFFNLSHCLSCSHLVRCLPRCAKEWVRTLLGGGAGRGLRSEIFGSYLIFVGSKLVQIVFLGRAVLPKTILNQFRSNNKTI